MNKLNKKKENYIKNNNEQKINHKKIRKLSSFSRFINIKNDDDTKYSNNITNYSDSTNNSEIFDKNNINKRNTKTFNNNILIVKQRNKKVIFKLKNENNSKNKIKKDKNGNTINSFIKYNKNIISVSLIH